MILVTALGRKVSSICWCTQELQLNMCLKSSFPILDLFEIKDVLFSQKPPLELCRVDMKLVA